MAGSARKERETREHEPPTPAIHDVKALATNPADREDDPADLAAMFARHVRPLLRYCACRVGADAAEDIVAETFVIAYAQRQRFDPARGSALTWLYGIATNVARRHRRTELRVYRTYARGSLDDIEQTFVDRATSRADAHLARRRVAQAMAKLPARQRDVLLLYAIAELEYAEIAAALNIPLGSVRSALHRARTKLRASLGAPTERSLPGTAPPGAAPVAHLEAPDETY
jgi:RNA polymerase sigma factor (sigma-70 family)